MKDYLLITSLTMFINILSRSDTTLYHEVAGTKYVLHKFRAYSYTLLELIERIKAGQLYYSE